MGSKSVLIFLGGTLKSLGTIALECCTAYKRHKFSELDMYIKTTRNQNSWRFSYTLSIETLRIKKCFNEQKLSTYGGVCDITCWSVKIVHRIVPDGMYNNIVNASVVVQLTTDDNQLRSIIWVVKALSKITRLSSHLSWIYRLVPR